MFFFRKQVKNKKSSCFFSYTALFMPNFGIILGAIFEIIRNAQTHGETERIFIGPSHFSTGDQKILKDKFNIYTIHKTVYI